jgi:hypothetical protein
MRAQLNCSDVEQERTRDRARARTRAFGMVCRPTQLVTLTPTSNLASPGLTLPRLSWPDRSNDLVESQLHLVIPAPPGPCGDTSHIGRGARHIMQKSKKKKKQALAPNSTDFGPQARRWTHSLHSFSLLCDYSAVQLCMQVLYRHVCAGLGCRAHCFDAEADAEVCQQLLHLCNSASVGSAFRCL